MRGQNRHISNAHLPVHAVSGLCWYLSHYSPTFNMLHCRGLGVDLVERFDWIGIFLDTGSLPSFLMGLAWGGSANPWHRAHVLGALVARSPTRTPSARSSSLALGSLG